MQISDTYSDWEWVKEGGGGGGAKTERSEEKMQMKNKSSPNDINSILGNKPSVHSHT